jgi:hypothetical protein
MKTLRNKTVRYLVAVSLAGATLAGCGDEPKGASPGAGGQGGGEPRFEIVSSWEPALDSEKDETRIEYALVVANRGSAPGEASCEIWTKGERLPGESSTVTIEPGGEATVEGEARSELDAEDVNLVELTPRCE